MIINARVGQRSNRIIQIAHGLATALRRCQNVRITEISDLASDYVCVLKNDDETGLPPIEINLAPSRFWKIERKLHSLVQRIFGFSFNVPGIVTDWSYRDYEGVETYRDQIIHFFTPRFDKVMEAEKRYQKLMAEVSKIIFGVHIRRGDYAQWQGGRYCYEDSVYRRQMENLVDCLKLKRPSCRSVFILFSNEALMLDRLMVSGADVVLSHGTPLEDHYLMSKCDYLFGPPSTFTRWAAYMGKKPLAYIEQQGQLLTLDDFRYMSI